MYIQLRDSFNTIKFPSTRLSCVHTLRKEAQEIAHRYTCNSAGICVKNQWQIVPTEELCSRVTTASLVMGPTSCECTKAILDPRITANNSLHMVMELGNKSLLIIDLVSKYAIYSYGNGYGGGSKPAQQQQQNSGKPVKVVLCERFSQGHCDR